MRGSCELVQRCFLSSAAGSYGELCGSGPDRARTLGLAAAAAAAAGSEPAGPRHIRGREVDPGPGQREFRDRGFWGSAGPRAGKDGAGETEPDNTGCIKGV